MNKKNRTFRRNVFALAVSALCLSSFASAQAAGLSDVLNEQFNTMSNVTQPGVFETQRRGVISGGSIATRSRVVNTQVVSWVPPSWKGGCGGIDLFAGSFSFINGEQFVQLLRSIAANAAGYAFQVALATVCEDCMTWIESLQNKMQALNQFAGNSCQLAQGLVNSATDAIPLDWKGRTNVRLWSSNEGGLIDDFMEGWTESGGQSAEEILKQRNPQKYSEMVTGNVIWRAMVKHNFADWFIGLGGGQDDDLLEEIMTLTGTVIIEDLEDDEDGNATNPKTEYKPLIGLTDLVEGGENLPVYRCTGDHGQDECLALRQENRDIEGMGEIIREILIGADGNGGVVAKFANHNPGTVITQREQNLMSNLPQSIGSMIVRMAAQSQAAAAEFVRNSSMAIAVDMSYTAAQEVVRAVDVALNADKNENKERVESLLAETMSNLRSDYYQLQAKYGSISEKLVQANNYLSAISKVSVFEQDLKPTRNANTGTH